MFSLVRSGPKMLLLESPDVDSLKEFLISQIGAKEYEFNLAFENASEEFTILYLTEKMKEIVNESDIVHTLVIPEEPDVALCCLINSKQNGLVSNIRTAPRIIIVRAIGGMDKVICEIHKEHGGSFGPLMELWNSHSGKGTLVAVTDKPLHLNMKISDLYETCLFIEQSFYPLFKSLRLHALKYLNMGLDNKDWYEIEIRIYDRYSAYKLHYQRLAAIIDLLDLGIILGESWAKDYPRFMMAVGVYRLRFFTFHDPKYIKKILLGLEYLEDGTRIVDYDIYYQRKKIDWSDAIEKNEPHTRHLLGLKYHNEIYSHLSSQESEDIKKLEEEILKTRY